jgi:hypothetical protein
VLFLILGISFILENICCVSYWELVLGAVVVAKPVVFTIPLFLFYDKNSSPHRHYGPSRNSPVQEASRFYDHTFYTGTNELLFACNLSEEKYAVRLVPDHSFG